MPSAWLADEPVTDDVPVMCDLESLLTMSFICGGSGGVAGVTLTSVGKADVDFFVFPKKKNAAAGVFFVYACDMGYIQHH